MQNVKEHSRKMLREPANGVKFLPYLSGLK